ncbi:MAG: hypothetical protein ACR2PA_23770 [Hyphomicrobiaceae bacterium]
MTRTTAILTAVVAATVVAPIVFSTNADAKKRGSYRYEETFQTRDRQEGYEGFVGIGRYSAYCSFYRVPKRSCNDPDNGKRRCKVVGWILHQSCY